MVEPPTSDRVVWTGRVLIAIAALLWSTSGFFAKAPVFDNWPQELRGSLLAFWRAAFASLVLVFLVRKVKWSWKLIPTTIAFALMNLTYLNSLVHNEATLAIWLQYTSPVWVFLFGWRFIGDKPIRRDWVLLMFAGIGMAIIIFAEASGASALNSGFGISLGLLSGVCFAAVVLTLRWCRDLEPAWVAFMNHVVTSIVFAPVVLRSGIYPEGNQWFYLLAFGGIQLGIPYVVFSRALKVVPSHEASGITLLEPLLVPVWVFVAWGASPDYSPPAWTTVIGGALILSGLIIRYWDPSKGPNKKVA